MLMGDKKIEFESKKVKIIIEPASKPPSTPTLVNIDSIGYIGTTPSPTGNDKT